MQLTTSYANNNYPIIVEKGALQHLNAHISQYKDVFIFIDESVAQKWQSHIDQAISNKHHQILIPSSEQVKYLQFYESYMNQLLEHQPTRHTCLVAIGGGATGDFVGFLAATLLRGVSFIQVPTTLLAHDSSVGGKVGINAQQGKNLIGAFHRPKAVIYDLDFLTTLPETEVLSGYAEVYKHALLRDDQAVQTLETAYPTSTELLTLAQMDQFLIQGIETKLNIVIKDEKEQGQRKFLNLGHTFGHAIEYQYRLPHGHAVMIGIVYQFIVANHVYNTAHDVQHYYDYLKALGYPLHIIAQFDFDQLYQLMLSDKKNDAQGVQMVLLKTVGQPEVHHVSKAVLHESLNQFIQLHNEVT